MDTTHTLLCDDTTQIIGDKLNKDNYHIWSYRMENFLMGKGLWGLVNGEDECLELPNNWNVEEQKEYKTWIEKSRKVLPWISIYDDMVSIRLNGLGPQYKSLDSSISMRGTMQDFDELVALCMTEEVKLGLNASRSERGSSHGCSNSRNVNTMGMPRHRGRSNSRGRGRSEASWNCYHCGKYGHFEKDCY
ncbi:hypothetical protein KP509_12G052900 [Ceratopteris richardii]|uniref:CCHC-type domain-containing protein n=1 Tax=Ceratopteris richardii TaxID=49495 RepID=A0A8T2TNV5_CERRI|nr:hypothetical protein KP509_12G052900 [Ceratopteris richardii]